jgi:hypothetical protein
MANAPSAKTTIPATPMTRPSGPPRRRDRGRAAARGAGRLLAGPRCDRRRFATDRWYVLPRRGSGRGRIRRGPGSHSVHRSTGNRRGGDV